MNPNTTIATAPEVPSTNINYYDPTNNNTNTTANTTNNTNYYSAYHLQQSSPSSDMSSAVVAAAAVAAAAAAAAGHSLPPLSDLLPNNTTATTTLPKHSLEKRPENPSENYMSSQMTAVVSSQPQVNYRRNSDYRAVYHSEQHAPENHRRSFVSPQNNGYFVYPPPAHTVAHYPPPPPPPTSSSTHDVPSTDLSNHPPSYHRGSIYHHLPSPPTSVIDGVLVTNEQQQQQQNMMQHHHNMAHHSQKVFSFVPLPGLNQKKRPRRKFHEVERLYQCSFQDCTKAYGTLNHLNAHVSMQRHGPKRQPSEFKELRKMWRKQKRDNKQRFNSHKTPPLADSTLVDSNDDILNHSNSDYMLPPPPSSGSSFMHQQQTYSTNTHWIHRPSYPPPSTHFMPSGY